MTIYIVDRKTKEVREEIVYGESLLHLLYKQTVFSNFCRALISKMPLASSLFGVWQKNPFSKRQIAPFVKKFDVNLNECAKQKFSSFNDFFIRKLKKGAREIATDGAVCPADGRYLAYDRIALYQEIFVKGQKLSISKLLEAREGGVNRYIGGSLLMARLAPADYHRFHFPVDCTPSAHKLIGGYLYSVNPVSLRTNISYLSENKRVVIELQTEQYGLVSFIAVGATNVGSIHFTYEPGKKYRKGDEMGYFSFGASMCICLFEPGKLTFSPDLTENTASGLETLCQMGQSLTS
jgi:phosphatidylserine decarboxylase